MERIKQALDKAKEQRDNTVLQTKQQQNVSVDATEINKEDFSYSQTQSMQVSIETLENNRIIAGFEDDSRADIFKILRTKIIQRMRANKWNVLAVTSPTQGSGKSLTAINLAISIAMDANYSVLLVDLDLRKPHVHEYLDIPSDVGVRDYFEEGRAISDLLIHPGMESLVVLPAGKPLHRSSDLLSTPKMLDLANELKNRYPDRIVVVDLPPLLQTDDAMIYMPNVDACVLVVAEGETSPEEVQNSIQLIDKDKFLGCILNKSTDENTEKYY